jgi:hypothetical protein
MTRRGFLVVLSADIEARDDGVALRKPYEGVDRVPAYRFGGTRRDEAMEAYVFGEYKDPSTNLVPTLSAARRLCSWLSASKRERYEVLYCCESSRAQSWLAGSGSKVEDLGYDVASLGADYWSIVGDMPQDVWVRPHRKRLNSHGLFSSHDEATSYLTEYRRRDAPDSDAPLEVVFVARVS